MRWDALIEANLRRADLVYEATFSAPSFELPVLGTALLKSLYESLRPLSLINTTDLRVLGGNALSEVRVQLTLFGGLGLIDVGPDGITMNFRDLRNTRDFATCMDCILLGEEVTLRTLPNCEINTVVLRPTLFLDLDSEVKNASEHLANVLGTTTELNLQEFGNPVRHHGVNLEIENTEQDWRAIFNAYRDQWEKSLLVVSCYAQYGKQSAIQGTLQRAGHLERLIRTVLRGIGVELSSPFWEAV